MTRIALVVAYNGHHYHGWQFQSGSIATVQQELTKAVSTVADTNVVLHCAGRTDTGVHATKQIIHFDSPNPRPLKAWTMGVNAHLSDHVSVEWAGEVEPGFDARRTATARRYVYLIHNSKIRSALMSEFLTSEHRALDERNMHIAAQALLGENDFSSFRAANCQSNSPMRNMQSVAVFRRETLVGIDVTANAFLHHMVRNIVGSLLDVGAGEKPVSWIADVLSQRDRSRAGVTAAPNGLYLVDVRYPDSAGIPVDARLPHFLQMAC